MEMNDFFFHFLAYLILLEVFGLQGLFDLEVSNTSFDISLSQNTIPAGTTRCLAMEDFKPMCFKN